MKYRKLFFKFLAMCLLLAFVIIGLLNERYVMGFIINDLHKRYTLRGQTIRELAKELAGREFYVHRANERMKVKRIEYLEYLENALQVNDKVFFQIVNAVYVSFNRYGLKKWLDNPSLVLALIGVESSFNPYATTYKTLKNRDTGMPIIDSQGNQIKVAMAQGVVQIHTDVWEEELKIDRLRIYEIEYNVDLGIQIIKIYLEASGGNFSTMLQKYVGDKSHVDYPEKVLTSKHFSWRLK